MAYKINEAKALVIDAGKELLESGLIARTWGNVSARISDTQFVITPSGRAYETLTPDELVVVNIADCSYEGDIKPSSEKGVHAEAYRLRPDVDFIIHTHQLNASAISPTGRGLTKIPNNLILTLGPTVPVAPYGMPSTDKLKNAVAETIKANKASNAIIMKHHGALCLGETDIEAFKVASALEDLCNKTIGKTVAFTTGNNLGGAKLYKAFEERFAETTKEPENLGKSRLLTKNVFELSLDGKEYLCSVETGKGFRGIAPRVAEIHSEIYKNSKVKFIEQHATKDVVALSRAGADMKPHLDDFAQIAGTKVECKNWEKASYRTDAKEIGKASKGRNAVLIKGHGALCTGNSEFDIEGVKKVLEKECKAEMYCKLTKNESPLSPIDTHLMRTIYNLKYSKQANK